MSSKNYSIDYLNKIRSQLVAIFNHAKKYFHLEKNPCADIGNFKSNKVKKEMLFWTNTEFRIFSKSINSEFYKAMFITFFKTGFRKGELQALQWKNFKDSKLSVKKTWAKIKPGEYGCTAPKTLNSYRTIKIDKEVVRILNERFEQVQDTVGFSDDFYIFGSTRPVSASQIDRKMREYITKSDIKKIRIHDLRHSHAAYLISLGANIVMISKRLGHASTQETLDTYGHLYPDQEDEIIQKMENGS